MRMHVLLLFCSCTYFSSCAMLNAALPLLKTAASFTPLATNLAMQYIPGAKEACRAVLPQFAVDCLHFPVHKSPLFRWSTTIWPIAGTVMFCNALMYHFVTRNFLSNSISLPLDKNQNFYKVLFPLGIAIFALFNTLYPLHRNAELNRYSFCKAVINYLVLYGLPTAHVWSF
ncbi:hypothetical protein EKK58_10705 [Candidatus Dependentiae bacterium]|nr:MAG: hypothetical protein EKK58_10705 [Candidatus Dependentiae bacterium]